MERTEVGFPVVMIEEAYERLGRLRVDRLRVSGMRHLGLRFGIEENVTQSHKQQGKMRIKNNTNARGSRYLLFLKGGWPWAQLR